MPPQATSSSLGRVFVNCPFDSAYRSYFQAAVFTLIDCGFEPRCALETDDGGQTRIEKIIGIVRECNLGIHDICRTELDEVSRLPRFNMPFELGLLLGAKNFGVTSQRKKRCLILDVEPFRYQKFLSDISGQDIGNYDGDREKYICKIRDWLNNNIASTGRHLPGAKQIAKRLAAFEQVLPSFCEKKGLELEHLSCADFNAIVTSWLKINT